MLETVGQFGLQYREQTQGTLGSLVATPSRTEYSQVRVTRDGSFT